MKKYILVLLITIAAIVPVLVFKGNYCPRKKPVTAVEAKKQDVPSVDLKVRQENLLKYLKLRKDNLAAKEIDKILSKWPDDICALWARAEIVRRAHKYAEAEKLLKQVLAKSPDHASSLISLSYIKYHDNEFEEAAQILKQVLRQPNLERENKALAYMLIGSINVKRASLGGFLGKVVYGMRIKGFFEKAKAIAPDLSEVHLGLGSFYLLVPKIAGGNIDRAIEELKWAVELTPDFATANARLAQAYKKKGILEKYNFYIQRAKELDPDNEVVREIEKSL